MDFTLADKLERLTKQAEEAGSPSAGDWRVLAEWAWEERAERDKLRAELAAACKERDHYKRALEWAAHIINEHTGCPRNAVDFDCDLSKCPVTNGHKPIWPCWREAALAATEEDGDE